MKSSRSELRLANIAFLDGKLSEEQVIELSARLRSDPEARRLYLQLADEHSCLAVDESLWSRSPSASEIASPNHRRKGWLGRLWRQSWAPLGVGLAAGAVCTSVVWGRVTAIRRAAPVAIRDASFEEGVPPAHDGIPSALGVWSGDFSSVVSQEQEVVPAAGTRMLRFLRPDNRHTPGGTAAFVTEAWYMVDMRAWRATSGRKSAMFEVSAAFNSTRIPETQRYTFGVALHAFRGTPEQLTALWRNKRDTALASADMEEAADNEPVKWQRLNAQIVVPEDADVLMIQLRVTPKLLPQGEAPTFPGHYVDDIRLSVLPELSQ